MKKKIFVLLLTVLCITALIPLTVTAEETESVTVTVNVINDNPVLAAAQITVTDTDGDGLLTINDALYCAHQQKYQGGAEAGFASSPSSYGITLEKLWGDTSGAFGYYLNNESPQSLLDTVVNGDTISAFIYQDTFGWSDCYSYFDKNAVTVTEGDALMLNLSYLVLDYETWMTSALPAEGATITIDGEDTEITVNMDGVAMLTFDAPGTYLVSAHSDLNIVAPVCVVTVEEAPDLPPSNGGVIDEEPQSYGWIVAICAAVICSATAVAVAVSQKNTKKK